MRWESLFEDLEAELAAEFAREKTAEIQETVRVEKARQSFGELLAPQLKAHIEVRLLGGERLHGRLSALGLDWVMLRRGETEELIPIHAIGTWLQRTSGQREGSISGSARFTQALRALVRDRSRISVGGCDGSLLASGTLDQVGHDFMAIALHARDEFRRETSIQGRAFVPIASVAWVRREA
ncbi:hypothetical protein CQ018_00920 [Arthrobacter sp. MYb227]|uniref:hypothetical protein n=1 Tax=Arthrobacter sp. MYb227 TaxID=1848601 RepID=UPI000CFAF746|nr:hypothetical protein [Arthrobacter sp. MYb227]PQZ95892.1 hypothetical protein CQ018_00920 [Arthrobacter sp. MYb227]